MNLAFNETSFQPYYNSTQELQSSFIELLKLFKSLQEEYGFQHLVFPVDIYQSQVLAGQSFVQWVEGLHGIPKQAILSVIKRPFSNEELADREDQLNAFYFENPELGIEQNYCTGLGLAYLQRTATLSLHSHAFWCADEIEFIKMVEIDSLVKVVNTSYCGALGTNFIRFAEANAKIELIETELTPAEKHIHFRDDHGTDILMAFAKRLVQSVYVTEVINSLEFNAHTSRFIRRISDNGQIELVLHWEDKGYGMVIQTTGRNHRETEKIAHILRDKYDR